MLFLLILILPFFVSKVESSTSTNTLYAHAETTTIGSVNYYLHKLSSADGPATTLNQSAASTGRKLMGRWVYSLNGIISIPASTWTVTYRAMKSASASSVVAHGDIDILIRKGDGIIRTTIATNVANSPCITLTNVWQTLTGTYSWAAYTVVDQTDYLEVAYYIEVTTLQNSKSVRLLVDDSTLALADQTKVENVMFTYPNQAPIASFTFSPSNPLVNDTATFDASASHDPDGSIVSYRWDFGDGNVTTVTNPIITHVYLVAGSTVNYTATLTVTDNEGSTGIATQIVPVTNPSILHVSLPAGTYVGPDPDHWLSQCWLLNITGLSGTFTLRVDNIHSTIISYDTHLIIALNNASYEYLDSLTVDTVVIPKTSFTYGTPTPYGFTLTWEEDVYPTWFSDIYNGFGTIGPSSYKEAQVSVTFTNATGVRMHFDAYGSTDSPPPPTGKGHVTHNAHEKDSTVLFSPPTVVQYYLTVTSTYGTVSGQGWYVSGSTAYASLDTGTVDHGNGTRRVFLYWNGDASGNNYTQSDPIFMDGNKTAIAVWKTRYRLSMSTNFGITSPSVGEHWYDSGSVVPISTTAPSVVDGERYVWLGWSGTGTISYTGMDNPASVTMNSPITQTAAWRHEYRLTMATNYGTPTPSVGQHWYEAGTVVPIQAFAPSVVTGERYVWNGWTGTGLGSYTGTENPSSVTMNGPITETASWTHQFLLTVKTSGLPTAYPTEIYLGGSQVGTASDDSPYTKWFDAGTPTGTIGVNNTVLGATGTRYLFIKWVEDSSTNNPRTSETMNSPKTFTAEYKTQYLVSFTQTGSAVAPTVTYTADTDPTGTVPFSIWVKAGSQITYTYQDIVPGAPGVRYVLTGVTPPSPQTVNSPLTISGSYKTQYLLTVLTDPAGLSPQPTRNPTGEAGPTNGWWYDATTGVTLTAQTVTGYTFSYWDVDGTSKGSGVNPIPVSMDMPHTATAHYIEIEPLSVSISPTTAKIKILESITFTSTVSGGVPGYSYQWYLNGAAVSGATFSTWTFTPVSTGTYTVYLNVTDSVLKTAKSNEASVTVAPPLTVSISPTSASILVGQSVTFASTVSGGYPPYSYQWYLNGALVSGATTWTLTPTTSGIYYVYLKVTDDNNNVAQSETARITVSTVPVGGYSISLTKQTPPSHVAAYIALIALFGAILSLAKRKRK
jgi:hypothetical protein